MCLSVIVGEKAVGGWVEEGARYGRRGWGEEEEEKSVKVKCEERHFRSAKVIIFSLYFQFNEWLLLLFFFF